MKHETYVQSKQAETAAEVRISSPKEHRRRAQNHSTQAENRQKGPHRLKKRVEFQRVRNQGDRLVGRFLCVDYKKSPSLKFGISASKRYGNSPERNRFKRLVREAFRASCNRLPQNLHCNVIPRSLAKKAKMADIQRELIQLLNS